MSNSFEFLRVAFLFPSLARGGYWQPVLARFAQKFPNTLVITGVWEGFVPLYRDSFQVEVVGRTRFIRFPIKNKKGHYPIGIVLPPLRSLISALRNFRPNVVFVSGYTLWTLIAVLFKPLYLWKIIVIYDGSSPSIDRTKYKLVLKWRRMLSHFGDAFISNTQGGKHYLVRHLGIPEYRVKVQPYEVPDVELWQEIGATRFDRDSSTVFLTVGSLIPRKGLLQLLEAVQVLQERSVKDVKVLIIGEGPLRAALEEIIQGCGLKNVVELLGQIDYQNLGSVIRTSDVFVFPSLEDVWGVAPLEAMAMGKPVIISKYAGAHELVKDGFNGFVIDPLDVESLAEKMLHFVQQPQLIHEMGQRAKRTMEKFTPDKAAEFLTRVALEAYAGNA